MNLGDYDEFDPNPRPKPAVPDVASVERIVERVLHTKFGMSPATEKGPRGARPARGPGGALGAEAGSAPSRAPGFFQFVNPQTGAVETNWVKVGVILAAAGLAMQWMRRRKGE